MRRVLGHLGDQQSVEKLDLILFGENAGADHRVVLLDTQTIKRLSRDRLDPREDESQWRSGWREWKEVAAVVPTAMDGPLARLSSTGSPLTRPSATLSPTGRGQRKTAVLSQFPSPRRGEG